MNFSAKVIEKLKYYVYLYIDPRDEKVFYIGKGKANRIFSHLADGGDSDKTQRINQLNAAKLKPRLKISKYGLENKHEAFLVESTAID